MTNKYIWYDSCPNSECKSFNFKQFDNDTNYSYKYGFYCYTTKLIKCSDCGKVYGYIFRNFKDNCIKYKIINYDKINKIYTVERCKDYFTIASSIGKISKIKRVWDVDEKNNNVEFLSTHFDEVPNVELPKIDTKNDFHVKDNASLSCFNLKEIDSDGWRTVELSYKIAESPDICLD